MSTLALEDRGHLFHAAGPHPERSCRYRTCWRCGGWGPDGDFLLAPGYLRATGGGWPLPIFAFCVAEGCRAHPQPPNGTCCGWGCSHLVSEIPVPAGAPRPPAGSRTCTLCMVFRFWPPRLHQRHRHAVFGGGGGLPGLQKLTEKGHRLLGAFAPAALPAAGGNHARGLRRLGGAAVVFLPFALEKKKYYLPALGAALTLLYLVHAAWVGYGLAWLMPDSGGPAISPTGWWPCAPWCCWGFTTEAGRQGLPGGEVAVLRVLPRALAGTVGDRPGGQPPGAELVVSAAML